MNFISPGAKSTVLATATKACDIALTHNPMSRRPLKTTPEYAAARARLSPIAGLEAAAYDRSERRTPVKPGDGGGSQFISNENIFAAFSDVILRKSSWGTPSNIRDRNCCERGNVASACG